MEGQLGQPVPLQTLERYVALLPEYTYPAPVGGLGLVHMQVPIENVVDGSQDGVSVYAAAVGLIHNINRNEAQINGEFERGESRIVVSSTMMGVDSNGRRKLTDNVFVGVDGDPEDIGVNIFSPDLRIQQFHERKREYLRNVESIIGIKRGLLSEVEAQERTAKEVTSSEGDYNLTIIDLQEVWTKAARDTVKLCGILGKLYKIPSAHEAPEDAVSIDWGNGVLYDEDKTWADYLDMVARGLLKPEIALGWRFGMPYDTEADLVKIREKYMPVLEQMAEGGEE
jgi:A118 family predicted phage portal protein